MNMILQLSTPDTEPFPQTPHLLNRRRSLSPVNKRTDKITTSVIGIPDNAVRSTLSQQQPLLLLLLLLIIIIIILPLENTKNVSNNNISSS